MEMTYRGMAIPEHSPPHSVFIRHPIPEHPSPLPDDVSAASGSLGRTLFGGELFDLFPH